MRINLDIPISISEITNFLGVKDLKLSNNIITGIATDSREAKKYDLFTAISGEDDDGENYVQDAIKKGAIPLSKQCLENVITVSDTVYALQCIATNYKKKLSNLKYTVGITGSVGKTTTKDFLKTIADGKYKTHATFKNYNNHIGLPMTILSAKKDTEILILEMGMNHKGEISALSKCASPDLGVITNIGTSHIGNLGSRENIAKAKLEIIDGMYKPHLIIPYGEHLLNTGFYKTTFSVKKNKADVYIIYNEEKIILSCYEKNININFAPRGIHMLECLSASVAAAINMDMQIDVIGKQISAISDKIPRQIPNKVGDFYILADYYNASLESIKAALKLLSSFNDYTHRSALIGTVKELGNQSYHIHREIGRIAALYGLRTLYLFGEFSKAMLDGALDGGMAREAILINTDEDNPEKTAKQILKHHLPGELILFKASNSTRLGRIANMLDK